MRKVAVAIVVAVLALAASATAQSLIDGGDVKNNSLTGKDVKDKSLTKRDFRGSVRGPRGFQGAQGAQGAQGPAGPTALGRLTRVQASVTVLAGDLNSATVNCPAGHGVVSGGHVFIAAEGEVFYSDTFTTTSWSVGGDNFDSSVDGTLTAVALCAPRGTAVTTARVNRARDRIEALEARQRATHQ